MSNDSSSQSSQTKQDFKALAARGRAFLLDTRRAGLLALVEFAIAAGLFQLSAYYNHHEVTEAALVFNILGFLGLAFCITHCLDVLKRRQWDAWFTVLAVLMIFFLAQAIAAIVVSLYPALRGWSVSRISLWLDNSIKAQFAFVVLASGFTLSAVYGYLKRFKIKLPEIGLRKPRWSDLGYGLLALPFYFAMYLLVVGIISQVAPGLDINQRQQLGFNDVHGIVSLSLAFISLVILPPLSEEIMMRGLLYGGLRKALPVVWAALLTSGLFAIAHLPEGGASGPLYIAAIDTFVLSMVLVYLREKTDGLWASISLHALKNGIAFVALFVLHAV